MTGAIHHSGDHGDIRVQKTSLHLDLEACILLRCAQNLSLGSPVGMTLGHQATSAETRYRRFCLP